MPLDELNYVYQELVHGNIDPIMDDNIAILVKQEALRILNTPLEQMSDYDKSELDLIILIANLIYNNTEYMVPLDDAIYDKLMVRAKRIDPNAYQIGARPISYTEPSPDQYDLDAMDKIDNLRNPIIIEPPECKEGLFYNDLKAAPKIDYRSIKNFVPRPMDKPLKKANIVVPHKYPKLVGTLDKCKFVLNREAMDYGCFNDPDIPIFERDFLYKHVAMGVINPNMPITLILELKYDGMSVEADVTNKILSARSRGDTNQDLAEDLSGVLAGYEFPNAPEIPDDQSFGMKFECIITKYNLWKLGEIKGKVYKNARNGVIGLMKGNDAPAYRDLITLVPLETSLDIDPITEIEFMNKYYAKDTFMKYAVVSGTYNEVLYQVYAFVKEAEQIRESMPFMYDGVVVHYYDQSIRKVLGRVNSVNQYSVAIKFNPMKKEATFTGYTFTVGQNGVITPMIHYTPVEFIGTIHTKSTGHSLERFNELQLAVGDVIEIEYRNDVMPYVTRRVLDSEEKYSDHNARIPVVFPSYCPECGNPLRFYDSGKTAVCDNPECPGMLIARATNMLKKLNIKGFAEAAVRSLGIRSLESFCELLNQKEFVEKVMGPVIAPKIFKVIEDLVTSPIDDFRLIGSLGFTNIAVETWKKILREIRIDDLIYTNDDTLAANMRLIKGIGDITIRTIITERKNFSKDILYACKNFTSMKSSYRTMDRPTVRYTGCRPDEDLTEYLEAHGFDANPSASVTRTTSILVVPTVGHQSSKMKKCGPNTMIVQIDEFKRHLDYYLNQCLMR